MVASRAVAVHSANMERAKQCVPFAAAGVSASMESSDADAERAAHPPEKLERLGRNKAFTKSERNFKIKTASIIANK